MDALFRSLNTGDFPLAHRITMAPLTRSRARMPGNIPWELNAEHYAQRADPETGAALIISEATPISPRAHGYYATPGIHTDDQVEGWKLVTDAVHARGGLIVCQLWHVGRVSHSALQPNNEPPVGPTDAISHSKTYIDAGMERVPNTKPRALRDDEIPGIVGEYADATRRAMEAGFDGVEIHGANTYLLDQFTRDGMNTREGLYGGTLEKRLRFPLEVAKAVCDVCGAGRVGYRVSPLSEHHDAIDSDPQTTFSALATGLGELGLAFIHAVETWDRTKLDPRTADVIPAMRDAFRRSGGRAYIANGDYSPEQAEQAIASGWCDAVAFGKLFISNPDLALRIRQGGPYNEPNRETFYGGGAEGYTDYPALA